MEGLLLGTLGYLGNNYSDVPTDNKNKNELDNYYVTNFSYINQHRSNTEFSDITYNSDNTKDKDYTLLKLLDFSVRKIYDSFLEIKNVSFSSKNIWVEERHQNIYMDIHLHCNYKCLNQESKIDLLLNMIFIKEFWTIKDALEKYDIDYLCDFLTNIRNIKEINTSNFLITLLAELCNNSTSDNIQDLKTIFKNLEEKLKEQEKEFLHDKKINNILNELKDRTFFKMPDILRFNKPIPNKYNKYNKYDCKFHSKIQTEIPNFINMIKSISYETKQELLLYFDVRKSI